MNQEQNNNSITDDFHNKNFNQQQININNMKSNNTNEISNNDTYNQQLQSMPVQVQKKNNIKLFVIISLIALILIIVSCIIGLKIYKNSKVEQNDNNSSNNIFVRNQLWNDFQNQIITVDEYVRYSLYAVYDKNLLDKRYSNLLESGFSIHVNELIDKYYEDLSDETLKYYLSNFNLENVTFELDKENDDDKLVISDLFIDKVYAKADKVTNLNKAILSKNGNIVVWYTTTGISAITREEAQKVADDIETSIENYNSLFDVEYKFISNILSKGKKYKDQLKILESENIDAKYLESAMQIYCMEAAGDFKAQYNVASTFLSEMFIKIFGAGDKQGSIMYPYMILRPSDFSNYENLSQVYNHELFHHYQYNILSGDTVIQISEDPYIVDATANWASSLVTTKTTSTGLLNGWAGTARIYSSSLMSDEWANEYGIGNVGYALFVYLNNYSSYVNNGIKKIIDSIYKSNALKYLEENATKEELMKIQEKIALNNLSQEYTNINLLVDTNDEYPLTIKETITGNMSFDNVKLNKLAIDYYLLKTASTIKDEITLARDDDNVIITLIGKDGESYELLETSSIDNENCIFNTNYYDDYDEIYIAVQNISLDSEEYYSLNVNETEIIFDEEVESNLDNNNVSDDDGGDSLKSEVNVDNKASYYDDNTLVYNHENQYYIVWYYRGETITGLEWHFHMSNEENAKKVKDGLDSGNHNIKNIDTVFIKNNVVIVRMTEDDYAHYTTSQVKKMHSMLEKLEEYDVFGGAQENW